MLQTAYIHVVLKHHVCMIICMCSSLLGGVHSYRGLNLGVQMYMDIAMHSKVTPWRCVLFLEITCYLISYNHVRLCSSSSSPLYPVYLSSFISHEFCNRSLFA